MSISCIRSVGPCLRFPPRLLEKATVLVRTLRWALTLPALLLCGSDGPIDVEGIFVAPSTSTYRYILPQIPLMDDDGLRSSSVLIFWRIW